MSSYAFANSIAFAASSVGVQSLTARATCECLASTRRIQRVIEVFSAVIISGPAMEEDQERGRRSTLAP